MPAPILLRGARQILTLRDAPAPATRVSPSHLHLLEDASLLIHNSLISDIGSTRRLANLSRAASARQIDLDGSILLPAFIDLNVNLLQASTALPAATRKAKRLVEHGTTTIRIPPPTRKALPHIRTLDQSLLSIVHTDPHPGLSILDPLSLLAARQPVALPDTPLALTTAFDGVTHHACSLQTAISLAHLHLGLSIEDAIFAATHNPAWALGLHHLAGSLQPGMPATFLVLDVPDYRAIPHHLGENLVRAVFRNGAILYRRGDLAWHNP